MKSREPQAEPDARMDACVCGSRGHVVRDIGTGKWYGHCERQSCGFVTSLYPTEEAAGIAWRYKVIGAVDAMLRPAASD